MRAFREAAGLCHFGGDRVMDNLKKLIEKSRRGDRRAQDQLILKVQNRVYYHCRKILSNEEDALDATQDILIAMLKGLGNLR